MAWRPNEQFIEGVLDNTQNGRVTGWMKFAGMDEKVKFDLKGNFHRDIRGAKVRLRGDGESANAEEAAKYMEDFSVLQKGKAGDMTAGLPPVDYSSTPYWEWYSQENGRCVIELEPEQVELLTQPIPACESDPIDRNQQAENMAEFLSGMKLLPKEVCEQLPPLYAQDGKGGKAIAYVKFFAPDTGSWTWWITEAGPVTDAQGHVIDYQMFGLVQGHCKELGYVSLNELEEVRGPMGLPVERDLYFEPKPLAEIAPELFACGDEETQS